MSVFSLQDNWLLLFYMFLVENKKNPMASSRLFNSIGKINNKNKIELFIKTSKINYICHKLKFIVLFKSWFFFLGRIGIGLAIAGGVINSMLYNGK